MPEPVLDHLVAVEIYSHSLALYASFQTVVPQILISSALCENGGSEKKVELMDVLSSRVLSLGCQYIA